MVIIVLLIIGEYEKKALGQHRDLKINYGQLGDIKLKIDKYISALDSYMIACDIFADTLRNQEGESFTWLTDTYDKWPKNSQAKLRDKLQIVSDNLQSYMTDMTDLIYPMWLMIFQIQLMNSEKYPMISRIQRM